MSIVGVGRLIRLRDRRTAEMSLIVSDAYRATVSAASSADAHRGRATEGLDAIVAEILARTAR